MKSLKTKAKQETKVYRRRRDSVARRASVPLAQLLPRELYAARPSPIRWDRKKDAFSERNTAVVALASYAVAASGLITAWILSR